MTPSHHPDADELVAYASGAGPDWVTLVVACHLTYCAECRGEVELLDDLGGVMLEALRADPEADALRPARHGAADAGRAMPSRAAGRSAPLARAADAAMIPRPLEGYVADGPRWRFLAPGIRHIPLSFSVGGVPARIVRFAPGFTVPEHAHRGLELVLVLDGQIADGTTNEVFGTGDLSRREEGTAHTQRITSADPCVCLVVSAAPIVPSTLWGRILKALTGV